MNPASEDQASASPLVGQEQDSFARLAAPLLGLERRNIGDRLVGEGMMVSCRDEAGGAAVALQTARQRASPEAARTWLLMAVTPIAREGVARPISGGNMDPCSR